MILELYDSFTQYMFLYTPCNQLLSIKNLRDTPEVRNYGCPDQFFLAEGYE